ncbi:hypothetical protein CEXT_525841 [Caerostris extrusa]|uniref:Uncharacterized protein n=1 Tax=Caerostris extrusa TaxID=172846 RepID=A0AAV4PH49_CAEEX|nr:hypothetical protein CEXT_525841 [Caerostris extrusa]
MTVVDAEYFDESYWFWNSIPEARSLITMAFQVHDSTSHTTQRSAALSQATNGGPILMSPPPANQWGRVIYTSTSAIHGEPFPLKSPGRIVRT